YDISLCLLVSDMCIRDMYNAMGHAVRANYLYAGVADLYAETGEEQLMKNLTSIWNDIVNRKMYITGACGALYDGTSPDGTCYEPDSIQKVHQSYGRPYQLPNSTAHNETCANIGNMLFNWRMLESTGDAKYADVVETALYNSVLSGVSLDGKKYFYTNPLRISNDLPYTLRWPKERMEYISCFCCPPNTLRTICEAQNYAYTVNDDNIWCNLYGDNELSTVLGLGKKSPVKISQHTAYPYDGKVEITMNKVPKKGEFTLNFRVPSWCESATITVNGESQPISVKPDTYVPVRRHWKAGDKVVFDMEMKTRLLESNPLVEETRNHTAVKRGPIVYCVESIDIEGGKSIDDILIPADATFTPRDITIDGSTMTALDTEALLADGGDWTGKLYRPVTTPDKKVKVTLIPYYAWGNRGNAEMSVWIPLSR
ncbi:MAG: glycoside hydrolase family 127 protein, partial [Duncaniella sp.]|nr:glycoside hydrolase family 127 protein [Duncaniella sp.]